MACLGLPISTRLIPDLTRLDLHGSYMTAKKTAGQRLRQRLDAALKRVADERNVELLWDEREVEHLEAAQAAADAAELLDQRLTDELDAATVVRLLAERRIQLKAVADHVDRLGIWREIPKSERHRLAGLRRWETHQGRAAK